MLCQKEKNDQEWIDRIDLCVLYLHQWDCW